MLVIEQSVMRKQCCGQGGPGPCSLETGSFHADTRPESSEGRRPMERPMLASLSGPVYGEPRRTTGLSLPILIVPMTPCDRA